MKEAVDLRAHDVLARTDRYLAEYLTDGAIVDTHRLMVAAWDVADLESPASKGGPVAFAAMLREAEFTPTEPGAGWGSPWRTTWFRVEGRVPDAWLHQPDDRRVELVLDLGFNDAKPGFQAEGLIRTAEGLAVKGLEPRNHRLPIERGASPLPLYVEAAANQDLSGGNDFSSPRAFAPTPLGHPATAGPSQYRLGAVELQLVDVTVRELARELRILRGLAAGLEQTERRAQLLVGIDRALSMLDPNEPRLHAAAARAVLAPLLAAPAAPSAHQIVATGHAHIDSAWLWPTRETARKVTRTFANVLHLMERDPDVSFTCSSAQHFAWVKEHDPELYGRVLDRVREGRFVPVGNMWVESDVTMPSGESLARQLLYGSRFFLDELGGRSDVGWLPDSFGYPASLPQLLRGAGMRWFFTQKMCWNDTNTMPHHTFDWEGLDGSRILTHFPPNNTYSGDMRPVELARSVRNFSDHGRASTSLMPFGYGDGGGGPTREMTLDARIQGDLEGSPRLRLGTAREFFLEAEAELADPPVWSGEMYLEFHRGIYTSQARTKRGNRRNEALLVEAEAWWAAAALRQGAAYPHEILDSLWQEVLLMQFHDILPGSSIAWVHREAEAAHERITARLRELVAEALAILVGPGQKQLSANPATLDRADVPAMGISQTAAAPVREPLVRLEGGGVRLTSEALAVEVARDGTLTSVYDRRQGRDLLSEGRPANVLELHVDAPVRWDAWDLDRSALDGGTSLLDGEVTIEGDGVVVRRRVSGSAIEQRIDLLEDGSGVRIRTRVDWHERRRLLKLVFPLDVHAADAAYETQFGHVRRPVHRNTSWDHARYEVCAHRWVHVGEPDFGAVVANDGVYGHDVRRVVANGRVSTVVRQSLLRAPTFPDPDADQGVHEITTVLAPAATVDEALVQGVALGAPLRQLTGDREASPLVSLTPGTSVRLSAVKLAADGSGDLVVRVYESRGSRATARLVLDVPMASVRECDLTEMEPAADAASHDITVRDDAVDLTLRPFEVVTLRFSLDDGSLADPTLTPRQERRHLGFPAR